MDNLRKITMDWIKREIGERSGEYFRDAVKNNCMNELLEKYRGGHLKQLMDMAGITIDDLCRGY